GSISRLYRNGSTSSREAGPPRLNRTTPTQSSSSTRSGDPARSLSRVRGSEVEARRKSSGVIRTEERTHRPRGAPR
ncbi:MAG: hypothetical protein BRD30_04335, partial [Bacteroidetes bacterium QH_2_63_10]